MADNQPDNGGASSGGAGGEGEKQFTQADVNAANKRERERREKAEQELQKAQKTLADMRAELDDLKQRVPPPPAPGEPTDLKGEIELMKKRHEREMTQLKEDLAEEKKQREIEKRKRLETERDRDLNQALMAAGCIDLKGGRRYFLESLEFDDDQQCWMYRTEKGNLVKLDTGVKEELPDYLRPATMRAGGSGTQGGTPAQRKKQSDLDNAEKKLKELETAAKTGRAQDIGAYQRFKREVEGMRSQLAATQH